MYTRKCAPPWPEAQGLFSYSYSCQNAFQLYRYGLTDKLGYMVQYPRVAPHITSVAGYQGEKVTCKIGRRISGAQETSDAAGAVAEYRMKNIGCRTIIYEKISVVEYQIAGAEQRQQQQQQNRVKKQWKKNIQTQNLHPYQRLVYVEVSPVPP